ncbi:hypothetical protein PoB_004911100 [Plakobranchus ocellatus]|uniref:Uncharacterized protein n=1 Tax=Plakobranchus ocellatus TaxID=259542 RepID=A0AAV4BU74_9GAST|nr:hypothetical protein PoB_004911100 [Plakobranchus ocellatus]
MEHKEVIEGVGASSLLPKRSLAPCTEALGRTLTCRAPSMPCVEMMAPQVTTSLSARFQEFGEHMHRDLLKQRNTIRKTRYRDMSYCTNTKTVALTQVPEVRVSLLNVINQVRYINVHQRLASHQLNGLGRSKHQLQKNVDFASQHQAIGGVARCPIHRRSQCRCYLGRALIPLVLPAVQVTCHSIQQRPIIALHLTIRGWVIWGSTLLPNMQCCT